MTGLRGDLDDAGAREALDRALGLVLTSISATAVDGGPAAALDDGTTVVVLRSGATMEQVLPQLRAALGAERPHDGPTPA